MAVDLRDGQLVACEHERDRVTICGAGSFHLA